MVGYSVEQGMGVDPATEGPGDTSSSGIQVRESRIRKFW